MTSCPPGNPSSLTVATRSLLPRGPSAATTDFTATAAPVATGTQVTVGSGVSLTLCIWACA